MATSLAVVFGSYLADPTNARDLDILVISEVFRDVNYQYRRLLLPTEYLGKRLDPFCFTESEFRCIFSKRHPLIRAIMKKHFGLIGDLNESLG